MFDRRLLQNFDWPLLFATLAVCLIGVAAIHSASVGYVDESNFWLKQLMWIGAGLTVGFVLLLVDFRILGQFSYLLHLGVIGLLLLLLINPTTDATGVARWIRLGPVSLQPSEFAKFSTVMAIAFYYRDSRRVGQLGLMEMLFPLAVALIPFVLIMKQPDLGSALLILMIAFPMVVMAGLSMRIMFYMGVLGIIAIVVGTIAFQFGYYKVDPPLIATLKQEKAPQEMVSRAQTLDGKTYYTQNGLLHAFYGENFLLDESPAQKLLLDESYRPFITFALRPYQQKRIITFLNPEKDPLGAGYHVIQSKVAIGSGGFFGKGYGHSTQGQLNFLPARHTDFLFAIYAEEWGFLGAVVLVGLFVFIIQRCLGIILQTRDRFSAFVVMGITTIISAQVLVNLGMVVGLLPVVGVPLPYFSYGGSSMVTMLAGMALIINIRMRSFVWG